MAAQLVASGATSSGRLMTIAVEHGCDSGIAVRIRRRIASFESDLMRAMRARPSEVERLIDLETPGRRRVELDHPAVDPVRIELIVDGPVKRVREIDAVAVAADLDHLRPAVERPAVGAGGRRARGRP